ncbi:MAG: hypothetical protein KDG89_06785 [Geminicoccaceae bacterium]|nr:hypothetical protein [Geminicoccaceae bacterium]
MSGTHLASWRGLLLGDHGTLGPAARVVLDDIRHMAGEDLGLGLVTDDRGRVDPFKLAMKEGAMLLVAAIEARIEKAAQELRPRTPTFARVDGGLTLRGDNDG